MKKKKVLFSDIGGVLLTNGWGHESRKAACNQFGLDYDELDHRHNFIFNVYEIGKISLDAYLDTIVFYEERNFTKIDFINFMYSCSAELPDMLPWLVQWKEAHPDVQIISINNEPRELNKYRIRKFYLHRIFDAFISSCEVGMRKPDPGIFELATGIAQSEPSDCIYFDDRPMLVKSAAKTGLNAFVHKDFKETKKIIKEFFP